MTKILTILYHAPCPVGDGGQHRSYQIYHDVISEFGSEAMDRISVITPINQEKKNNLPALFNAINRRLDIISRTLKRGFNKKVLFNSLLRESDLGYYLFEPISLDIYKNYLNSQGKPDICIVDHPMFLPLIEFNQTNNIPTLICPHNFETFDIAAHHINDDNFRKKLGVSLIFELEAIARSNERLMISKVETTLLNGLGVKTLDYPYLPVGEIRQRLISIRSKRLNAKIDQNLFLMLGSVLHNTTYEGFNWFLNKVQEFGLPNNTKIIVGGRNGEILEDKFSKLDGIEFHGFIDQPHLDDILQRIGAVLIPQMSGFGSVTRIPEMACAGIPVIASQHTIVSLNKPPGIHTVNDDWSEWVEELQKVKASQQSNTINEYEEWETSQSQPLIKTINKYLKFT